MIYDKHANLKYKYGNRHFWAEGYYVSTVGLNEATIKKYDKNKAEELCAAIKRYMVEAARTKSEKDGEQY